MMTLVYLFGILFFFSLPVAIVIEAAKWARRRKQKKIAAVSQSPVAVPVATPQAMKFCTKCGTTLQTVGVTGARICPKCLTVYP
jgi:NADH pyrophosphatase NudC (nudix superfamily)